MAKCGHNDHLCDKYGCPDDPGWVGDTTRGSHPGPIRSTAMDWHWNWPFPRLRYWLKHRVWCRHPSWSSWRMIDTGMRQIRWCERCDKAQIR